MKKMKKEKRCVTSLRPVVVEKCGRRKRKRRRRREGNRWREEGGVEKKIGGEMRGAFFEIFKIILQKCRASHRGDQGGPVVPLGEKKKNKGGPGGTSLPLSVPRLPVRNFPHFF